MWALDFHLDHSSDCRVLKYLKITDEFSKEALINVPGAPEFVRVDNGTEMTSNAVADWCRFSAADISFIEPGSPWQHACVESFNGKVRGELLDVGLFTTLLEARIMAEDYRAVCT